MQDDIRKKMSLLGGRGLGAWLTACFSAGSVAVAVYRFGHASRRLRIPFVGLVAGVLYFIAFYFVQALTGISVQALTPIGRRFVILHHSCIFIVAESIGDDFTACQGVTVGNIRGSKRLPILGSNVYLEPGCKVLGAVTIGDDVVVRANALVLSDVPSHSIVVGNPARILPKPVDDPEGLGA